MINYLALLVTLLRRIRHFNHVNMLLCMRSWLSDDIWAWKCLCYLPLL